MNDINEMSKNIVISNVTENKTVSEEYKTIITSPDQTPNAITENPSLSEPPKGFAGPNIKLSPQRIKQILRALEKQKRRRNTKGAFGKSKFKL